MTDHANHLQSEFDDLQSRIAKKENKIAIIKTKIEALTDELSEWLESLIENCFRTVNFDEGKQVSSTFNFALKIVSRLEEYSKHKLIRFAIRFLKGFKVINLDEVLLGYQHGDIKQIVIDFLFELKDNLSFSPSDLGESMEVVYEVMGFLFGHNLEPSKELKERYSESDINNNLKFPDYEDGPKQIGMSKQIYYDMIKRCIKRGAFNFYFHSTLNIDSVYGNNGKLNFILKGHFDENKLIGVGYTLWESGEFFQGYFKQGKGEWNGRIFLSNGDYYEGNYIDDKRHGKSYYEYNSKKFEIGEYSHGEQYGPAITYYRRKYVDRTVSIEDEIVKI